LPNGFSGITTNARIRRLVIKAQGNFVKNNHVRWLDKRGALQEIRRRTRVVGAFPDGESALMLVAARLRHVASSTWSSRKYLNMSLLNGIDLDSIA